MIEVLNYINLKEELNSEDNKNKLIILDFFATWCIPCRKVLQNLNELEKSISSKTILFIKKDIGSNEISNKQLVEEYNIKAVPLLLFIKNNEILYRIEGLKDGNFLKSIIDRFHLNQ